MDESDIRDALSYLISHSGFSLFLFIIAFILFVWLVNRIQTRKRKDKLLTPDYVEPSTSNSTSKYPDTPRYLPYRLKSSILTANELRFFSCLHAAILPKYIIAPKVRLADFISVHCDSRYFYIHLGKVAQKHVDFLICCAHTLAPRCAIELDDSSHNKPDTRKRDDFVNDVYDEIGLPVIRIKTRMEYTEEYIAERLKRYVRSSNHAE
jgi:hypothetical protein